jgi:hypothetical protein
LRFLTDRRRRFILVSAGLAAAVGAPATIGNAAAEAMPAAKLVRRIQPSPPTPIGSILTKDVRL